LAFLAFFTVFFAAFFAFFAMRSSQRVNGLNATRGMLFRTIFLATAPDTDPSRFAPRCPTPLPAVILLSTIVSLHRAGGGGGDG
jgi:hypothetical protein